MKKLFILFILFTLTTYVYSQDVTIRTDSAFGETDITYRIINKNQFDRVLEQRTLNNNYAIVEFMDSIQFGMGEVPTIIKGQVPILNGYFYMLVEMNPRTQPGREFIDQLGMRTSLMYGHSERGVMVIMFTNRMSFLLDSSGVVLPLDSPKFIEVFNRNLGFINN